VSRATFYFAATDGRDPLVFEQEGKMKRVLAYAKRALPVAKFIYQNRKAELALVTALIALGREVVQIATGH
jgi:hypothetical protein